MTDHDDNDPMAEWRAERKARRLELLTGRIPAAHRTPGDLHPDVVGWAKSLTQGAGANLALVGGIGCGKTWQAWHASVAALEGGWDGRVDFVTAGDFRARISPRSDHSHLDAIDLMRATDLLVLDDVGAHRTTDWWVESLHAVIDHRYSNMLPTVITSNMADLRAELGERIASRLAQDLVLVVLDGPDRRRS